MPPTKSAVDAAAMDVDAPRKHLTPESTSIMKEGIVLILTRWSALQMAVDNDWGGRNSRRRAEQLIDDILSWFIQSKDLYIDDLEAMLEECMLSLNTLIDDGSIEEIAESLMLLHEEILEGNYSTVENLRGRPRAPPAAHMRRAQNDEEGDSEEDDEEDTQGNTGSMRMSLSVDATNSISSTRSPSIPVGNCATSKTVEAEDGWTTVSSSRKKKAAILARISSFACLTQSKRLRRSFFKRQEKGRPTNGNGCRDSSQPNTQNNSEQGQQCTI